MPKKFTYIAKLDTGNPQHSGVWMKSFGIQRAFESFGFVTEIVLSK
ncbi:MAG: hypothetical protein IPO37_12750 [Saprospiraceae bacterium]|nr:hypothetical protein [Saprospiraceae bacterium]